MTTQRKITRPGPNDDEFMVVTCTPDKTAAEFFEYPEEAEDAARTNLHPTTTTYVGKVLWQGEHALRGTSKHIAICVEIDAELRRALLREYGARSREDIARVLDGTLRGALAALVHATRNTDREDTHPGVARPAKVMKKELAKLGIEVTHPPSILCHPGLKCTDWPECEHCGPGRM